MTPADHQRASVLFEQLRGLPDNELTAALDAACAGNAELRKQVMRLLEADRAVSDRSFLEARAIDDAARLLASDSLKLPDPGTVIGNYRLGLRIGAGGMGVVYEAQDLRLHRRVAVKILPPPFAGEGVELVNRFQRESRAASLLNHPNILTIFDAGSDQGHYYIATEFVEGKTLRSLASQGPLEWKLLVDVGIQVCSALAAAHEAGIVHRDIKPENVMIRRDGIVKVLDFGLAKMEHAANDATVSHAGTVLGTVAYMSPEQARGEEPDVRTDLFSFGAVLYEMATGQQAFSGSTTALIYDGILNRDPLPPSQLNSALPPKMDEIVLKALEKDRELRCQSAAELGADLKRVKRDTESGRSASAVSGAARAEGDLSRRDSSAPSAAVEIDRRAGPTPAAHRFKRRWLWAGAAAILIPAALAIGWYAWPSRIRPAEMIERQLTASFGSLVLEAAISPDGSSLAYGDNTGLYVKIIDTGEVHQLPWTPHARIYQIVWFPNNHDLLISAMPGAGIRTQLWTASVFGGAPKLLRDDARDVSVSWDGSRIAFIPNTLDSMWIMNSDGESAKELVAAPEGYSFRFPLWYPGDRILLYASYSHRSEKNSLKSFNVETGQPSLFSTTDNVGYEFCVPRDGRMLSLGGEPQVDGLYEIKADLKGRRPVGAARLLRQWPATYVYRPTVSANGKRLAFLKRVSEQTVFVAEIKDGGKRLENVRRLVLSGILNRARGWTPDGSAVVYDSSRGGSFEISRQRLDSVTPETLATTQETAMYARFSPDGKWLFYVLRRQNGDASLMRIPASGGLPQLVWNSPNLQNYYCTTAPVNFCVVGVREQNQMVFYRLDPTQDPPARGFRETQLRELGRTGYGADDSPNGWGISPDGSKVATVRPELNEGRIHIVPLAGKAGGHTPQPYDVIVKGWTDLMVINWAHEGRGWYISNRMDRSTGSFLYVDLAGNATVLNAPDSFVPSWGVPSPDGRHLAFSSYPGITNAWLIENF